MDDYRREQADILLVDLISLLKDEIEAIAKECPDDVVNTQLLKNAEALLKVAQTTIKVV